MNWSFFFSSSLLFMAAIGLLYLGNEARTQRYRQRTIPFVAIMVTLAVLYIDWQFLLELEEAITVLVRWLEQVSGRNLAVLQQEWLMLANLLILFAMAVAKLMLRFARAAWRLGLSPFYRLTGSGKAKQGPPSRRALKPAYRYFFDRGVSLVDSWVYPGRYFRLLALLTALAGIALLAALALDSSFASQLKHLRFPVLPLLVFLELGWYLGGKRPEDKLGSVDGDRVQTTETGNFQLLWEYYNGICPERHLAGMVQVVYQGLEAGQPTAIIPADVKNVKEYRILRIIEGNLVRNQCPPLSDRQKNALLDGLQGNDLLLIEPIFKQIRPVVFATLQYEYLKGNHILLLLPSDIGSTGREEVEQWLTVGFDDLYLTLAKPEVGQGKFLNRRVHLATVDEILRLPDLPNVHDWFERLTLVIAFDAPHFFHANLFLAVELCNLLADLCPEPPAYMLLANEDRVGEESSMRDLLGVMPKEYVFENLDKTHHAFHVWSAEGTPSFQDAILSIHQGRFLGNELPLALPALRDGLPRVSLFGTSSTLWHEELEEMEKSLPALEVKNGIEFIYLPSLFPVTSRQVVIGHDSRCNLVEAIRTGLHCSEKSALALVVSPWYMLRDYLSSNIDFFLVTRSLSSFLPSPRPLKSTATVAAHLYSRMKHSFVHEKILNERLAVIGYEVEHVGVLPCLVDLFQQVFGIDLINRNLVDQQMQYCYDRDIDIFIEEGRYRLSANIGQHLQLTAHCSYSVRDLSGNELALIPCDQVYQHFLCGQIHGMNGEPYEVQEIDDRHRVIKMVHTNRYASAIYRHACEIAINHLHRGRPTQKFEKTINEYLVRAEILELDLTVHTTGYHSFTDGWQHYGYTATPECPGRRYRNGRALLLNIQPQADKEDATCDVAYALSLLLFELMPTIFPETWRSLLINSPSFQGAGAVHESGKERGFHHPFDLLPCFKGATETFALKGSTILFVEDAQFDLGMIGALFNNWKTIFNLLEDYLAWLLESGVDDHSRTRFLRFGLPNMPEGLCLAEVQDLLARLLAGEPKRLRQHRQRYLSGVAAEGSRLPGSLCDFCGNRMSAAMVEQLEDGRERCDTCKETAVDTPGELEKVYHQARTSLLSHFNIELRKNIDLQFTSADAIAKEMGGIFQPSAGFDPRAVGFARRVGEQYSIFIENGQPWHMVLATLVHELTHIWQFDHLNTTAMKNRSGQLLVEGHAMWVELYLLKSQGIAGEYITHEKGREDVYGRGYWEIERLLQEQGVADPFVLLLAEFPQS